MDNGYAIKNLAKRASCDLRRPPGHTSFCAS